MKQIPLTQGKFALIDDADFDAVSARKWHAMTDRKRPGKWYAATGIHRSSSTRRIYLHRFLMQPPAGLDVDHRDGDGLNNVRSNLRVSTRSQNIANSRGRFNPTGYRGVYKKKTRYFASVKDGKRTIYLGTFDCPIEAAKVRDVEALRRFGEFAVLNFPAG